MSDDEKRDVVPFSNAPAKARKPFYPMTGNPEAHNYRDFIDSLQEGEIVQLADRTKKPPT